MSEQTSTKGYNVIEIRDNKIRGISSSRYSEKVLSKFNPEMSTESFNKP